MVPVNGFKDVFMKKYIDYMLEISKEDIRKGLLAYGLFADKLPAIFSAKPFYDYCEKKGFPSFEKKEHDYVRYESTRNTNIPRLFSIPSPFSYSNLCNCIANNWDEIIRILEKKTVNQKYKYSHYPFQMEDLLVWTASVSLQDQTTQADRN